VLEILLVAINRTRLLVLEDSVVLPANVYLSLMIVQLPSVAAQGWFFVLQMEVVKQIEVNAPISINVSNQRPTDVDREFVSMRLLSAPLL
jgi:hypothetical protein